MTARSVAQWLAEGQRHLDLSRGADSTSEYEGDLRDALEAYEQVLALQSDHREALACKADLLYRLRRDDEALDVLAVLRLRADVEASVSMLAAKAFVRMKRFVDALGAFDEVLAALPRDFDSLHGRAECLTELRRDEEALRAWEALTVHPENSSSSLSDAAGPSFRLGKVHLRASLQAIRCRDRLGLETARGDYRELFTQSLGALREMFEIDLFHEVLRGSELARAVLSELETHGPAMDANALRRAARTWAQVGETRRALRFWDRVLALEPTAQDWFSKAEAHAAAREWDQAVTAYDQALTLWPEFSGAATRRAIIVKQRDEERG